MQTKKLLKLLLLKFVVLLQVPLMAALFGAGAYAAGWGWLFPAIAGAIGAFVLIFLDERETWSKKVLLFPISTYLQSPNPSQPPRRLPE